MSTVSSPFKAHVRNRDSGYKGGKSRHDIQTDKPIYKLSSNENPLGASPKAMAAVRAHLDDLHEYPDTTDIRLRKALAGFYLGFSPEQFVTDNGGVGMIQLITNAFLGEGLNCVYSGPTFVPYHSFPEKIGAEAIHVPLEGDQFSINVPRILAAITEQTRLVWLCSPNNPTGTYIPKAAVDALVAALPSHVVLVYDEVYYQFATAADFTTAVPYVKAGQQVLAVNSFSKAYGLAGLRIGYAYSTPEIAGYLRQQRRPFYINTLSTEASIAALQDQAHIQATVELVNAGKTYLYRELDRMGVKYWRSQANFVMIQTAIPSLELEALLHQEGIMIRPADNFGATGCLRVTVGTEVANRAFIAGLEEVLR